MPAQLAVTVNQDRYVHAEALRQLGRRVNVHYVELESKTGLQFSQARKHFFAKMTMTATVYGKVRAAASFHPGGTARTGSWLRGG